jgi:hypothetical protein
MMRNEEKESFMTKKIDFISAENGGIKMYAGVGNVKGWAKTASGIAYTLAAVGISENCYGSSSMDFASEEGFENDGDAMKLWDEAIGIYNWEVNGVAG